MPCLAFSRLVRGSPLGQKTPQMPEESAGRQVPEAAGANPGALPDAVVDPDSVARRLKTCSVLDRVWILALLRLNQEPIVDVISIR
jgi:hypothetical protein